MRGPAGMDVPRGAPLSFRAESRNLVDAPGIGEGFRDA